MQSNLVRSDFKWKLEREVMAEFINKFEDYTFATFAGIDNCDYCDSFTHVNEWNRPDGGFVLVCNACHFNKRFPEIKKKA